MSIQRLADRLTSKPVPPSSTRRGLLWGDRYGKLEDPFGHHWSVGTHVRDVSLEEMQQAMQQQGA